MKLVLAFLALLAAGVNCAPHQMQTAGECVELATRGLQEDLRDFTKLIPQEETAAIALYYATNDSELKKTLAYLRSEPYQSLEAQVKESPQYLELEKYLRESGVDADSIRREQLEQLVQPQSDSAKFPVLLKEKEAGFSGYVKAITAILPKDKIKKLAQEKIEAGGAYARLVERLKSKEFYNLWYNLFYSLTFQNFYIKNLSHGYDIDLAMNYTLTVMGLNLI